MPPHSAIITSCVIEGRNQVCGVCGSPDYPAGQAVPAFSAAPVVSEPHFFLEYQEIPGLFHGTGDIFSAVLIAHLMKGEPLKQSTRKAMNVVSAMIMRNRDVKDRNCGIFIERCLDLIS